METHDSHQNRAPEEEQKKKKKSREKCGGQNETDKVRDGREKFSPLVEYEPVPGINVQWSLARTQPKTYSSPINALKNLIPRIISIKLLIVLEHVRI